MGIFNKKQEFPGISKEKTVDKTFYQKFSYKKKTLKSGKNLIPAISWKKPFAIGKRCESLRRYLSA